MSIVSIRFNKEEEQILNRLISHFEKDRSSLIKYSLRELYEDLVDRRAIEEFEARENDGSVDFTPSDQILKEFEEPSQ